MWNLHILITMKKLDHTMNHLEGYKDKKFDNRKRMFRKMLLSSVAYKNEEICIHAVSNKLKDIREYIYESSIFTKFFSLSFFIQDGIRRCNRSRSRT